MKFTRKQIESETQNIFDYQLELINSDVYNEWANIAINWFTDDPDEYLRFGFKGFMERTINEIVLDFYLNGKLEENLSEEEMNKLLS